MFLSTTHHPQLLAPECYFSSEQHERELRRMFLPGWHFVGTLADLRRDGDYLTTELFGRPILLYQKGGTVHGFFNVCAHRFSMLTCQNRGNMPTLRCQYHGWEYDDCGKTRKIPDARSFRPLSEGQFGLAPLRTKICGQLVFVCLTEDAPCLADYLGPHQQQCELWFGDDRSRILHREIEVDVNWKVKIENTLESYHIDCVHSRTFGRSPIATACTHTFDDRGSLFTTDEPPASRVHRWADSLLFSVMGRSRDATYKHWIVHPNLMYGQAGLLTWVEVVVPLSPVRSRIMLTMFCQRSARRNPLARLTQAIVGRVSRRFALRALDEDLAIVTAVQRGLQSPQRPAGGLISIREERIFHFQKYVQKLTTDADQTSR